MAQYHDLQLDGQQLDNRLEDVLENKQNIAEETARAQESEDQLHGNIQNEQMARITDVNEEEARAKAAEQALSESVSAEQARAEAAEQELREAIESASSDDSAAIAAERTRALAAEQQLQEAIESASSDGAAVLAAEVERAMAAEQQNADEISGINAKIPNDASASNQLATKGFVNSSDATATATFLGTYNLIQDLYQPIDATHEQIGSVLAVRIVEANNNDYAFVQVPTEEATPTEIARVERYKFNGSVWAFEYELNNSGFTSAQWEAINSMITSGLVAKLKALPSNSELQALLNSLDDRIAALEAKQQYTVSLTVVNGTKSPDSDFTVNAGGNSGWVIEPDEGYQLPIGVAGAELVGNIVNVTNIQADRTYIAECQPVEAHLPVYVGAGTDYASAVLINTEEPLTNNMGVPISTNNNDYLFIKVDKRDTVNNLYLNNGVGEQFNYPIPLEDAVIDGDYKYYRSVNRYNAGVVNYTINKV